MKTDIKTDWLSNIHTERAETRKGIQPTASAIPQLEVQMKAKNRNWGLRVIAFLGIALAFVFLGQLISFSWMAITAAVSSAVWMMIWLWPERVSEEAKGNRMQPAPAITKNDTYITRR